VNDQISEDGMWRWDGARWQPTEKNLAVRAPSDSQPVALQEQAMSEGTDVLPLAADTSSNLVPSAQPGKADRAQARAEARANRKAARANQKADARVRGEMIVLARSPAGRARTAFERGDRIFQCSFDVMSQQAVIVKMVGSTTTKKTSDPTETLNAVSREGWELVTGSFVFIEEGQQSRDKFLASGQNVATKGPTMGYYLFKRNEAMLARPVAATEDLLDQALDEVSEEEQQAPDA
jgi:hypothetical protein